MSTATAEGQTQPLGTVTLTAAAPAGGAVVRLDSSNPDVAKVASTITVAAGATSATFTVDTATVATRTTVTIFANYAGVQKTTTLTVTLPTPRASFTITSPAKGTDACMLIALGRQLDCRLDGRGSSGRIVKWSWTLEVREKITAEKTDGIYAEIDTTCGFVNGATASSDSGGRYVNMAVTLQVEDRDGTKSGNSSRTIKLYTDNNCGF